MRRTVAALLSFAPMAGAIAATPAPPAAPAPPAPSAAPPAAARGGLGRLFFTPIERAALDDARKRPAAAPPVLAAEKPPAPPPPDFVTLNGVVRRSDGSTTVWLNNKTVEGNRTEQGLIVSTTGRGSAADNVTVRIPQAGRTVNIRVGQQLEVNSGKVEEGYRLPQSAPAAAEVRAKTEDVSEPSGPRRPSARQRDALRDLLRDIEGPAPERPEAAPPGKG